MAIARQFCSAAPNWYNVGMKVYPEFAKIPLLSMRTQGFYKQSWPLGAVVHFTGGADGAEAAIDIGVKNGYAYWCIQRDGKLYCAHPANKWGWHAGESKWRGLFGSVSDDLIGIELNAFGRLTKQKNGTFKTAYGQTILPSEVRYCDGSSPDQCEGYYHTYTPAQEETLIKTLLWLKTQNPNVFSFDNVLGHSEVSGKLSLGYWRKNDPSAALSMTMPAFREHLKALYGIKK